MHTVVPASIHLDCRERSQSRQALGGLIFGIRGILTPKVSGAIYRWSLGDVEAWCSHYWIVKITVLHAVVELKSYQPVSALGLLCFEKHLAEEQVVCEGPKGMIHLRDLAPQLTRGSRSGGGGGDSIHRRSDKCGYNGNSCPTGSGSGE